MPKDADELRDGGDGVELCAHARHGGARERADGVLLVLIVGVVAVRVRDPERHACLVPAELEDGDLLLRFLERCVKGTLLVEELVDLTLRICKHLHLRGVGGG